METKDLVLNKSAGWKPNVYLSNLAIINYEKPEGKAKRVFPTVPVALPSGFYYKFSTEDLARDNLHPKPDFGSVQPANFSFASDGYTCRVEQLLISTDKLMAKPYETAADMGLGVDFYRNKVQIAVEQLNIHQEKVFAEKFFKSGVWANEWQGAATANSAQKKFQKWSAANSDPIAFLDQMATEVKLHGRRRPNKLVLGVEAYLALKNNAAVKERVKFSGSTANPAVVNENVLAQLFGLENVIVLDSTHNAAPAGQSDMKFIGDSKSALLLFAPDAPQIDIPSAGYVFAWQISGADYISIDVFDDDRAAHTEILELLFAADYKKTSDDLAVFMTDCI